MQFISPCHMRSGIKTPHDLMVEFWSSQSDIWKKKKKIECQ